VCGSARTGFEGGSKIAARRNKRGRDPERGDAEDSDGDREDEDAVTGEKVARLQPRELH
jgi:hypothetical protein